MLPAFWETKRLTIRDADLEAAELLHLIFRVFRRICG